MDTLDKWTILIITALSLYAAALMGLTESKLQAQEEAVPPAPVSSYVLNPELDRKVQAAADLLVQGNLDKTELLVDSLLGEFPYEGKLFMLKGDILMRRQQPIAAMYAYRKAIELNPDFLDRKTELFQGKKIKVTVEEALSTIESGLHQNRNDSGLKGHLQTVYYMKRKLAGSCG